MLHRSILALVVLLLLAVPEAKSGELGMPRRVLSTGWDWVPSIRNRQIGIWQNVMLSATGPVILRNPREPDNHDRSGIGSTGSARPLVVVDGWNVTAKAMDFRDNSGSRITTNDNARVLCPQARR